ncbi:hypothetical protein LUZ60_007675 [Juncus effusus]|nr:hypothetical protein LUZ60_007675 [Juncus effusus]
MKAIQFETLSREDNATPPMHMSNNLDLKLGISSDDIAINKLTQNSHKRSIGIQHYEFPAYKRSLRSDSNTLALDHISYLFSPYHFIDPWSLAARQQKASIEQVHFKLCNQNSSSSPIEMRAGPSMSQVVGRPPIRSCRRNLISINSSKSDESKDSISNNENNVTNSEIRLELKRTMFVKVNIDGYVVGRKIDLTSYHSYQSLSHALRNMFFNFLQTRHDNSNEKDEDANDSDFVLLYEDHEGDRMLVGDVPWELFITSVKRLYITHNSFRENADEVTKNGEKEAKCLHRLVLKKDYNSFEGASLHHNSFADSGCVGMGSAMCLRMLPHSFLPANHVVESAFITGCVGMGSAMCLRMLPHILCVYGHVRTNVDGLLSAFISQSLADDKSRMPEFCWKEYANLAKNCFDVVVIGPPHKGMSPLRFGMNCISFSSISALGY